VAISDTKLFSRKLLWGHLRQTLLVRNNNTEIRIISVRFRREKCGATPAGRNVLFRLIGTCS